MTYIPGFKHDLFVSYAHGDDRQWINRLVDQLAPALKQRLGVAADIWIDEEDLRPAADFSREILERVQASAVFLFLPSPSYIRSSFCIEECRAFEETLELRRARFQTETLSNCLFALRCPILPVDDNEHWTLFPGLTDVAFCDELDTFAPDSEQFKAIFRRLVGELAGLLKRMRNHSTPVFLYPSPPPPDLRAAHDALAAELSAQSFRILPDKAVNLPDQLRQASLAVFLLGAEYDETAADLAQLAATQPDRPWVAWCSPSLEQAGPEQLGFWAYLEQNDSAAKTYLNSDITVTKLKEEVLAILRPDPFPVPGAAQKPSVYLLYNARDRAEMRNAGLISFHFRDEVEFLHPDDPAQHTLRLMRSHGVLLVWGTADEDWCSREFAEMVRASRRGEKGLCLFDPEETKRPVVQDVREKFRDLYIGEQFGTFDPARLQTFFTTLRRSEERTA